MTMNNQDRLTHSEFIVAGQKKKERDYWMNRLAGEIEKSTFRYDKERDKNSKDKYEIESVNFDIPNRLCATLLKFCKGSEPLLFVFLAAVAIISIKKHCRSNDIIIGAPVIITDDFVGNLINYVLILRNQVDDDMSFKDVLSCVKESIQEAADHQNYPLNSLLNNLNLEFTGEDFPLFEIVVLLENIHKKEYIYHYYPNVIFDFLLKDENIAAALEYNARLYKKETLVRIYERFIRLLERCIVDVTVDVGRLEIISPQEKENILTRLNYTDAPYPADKVIHRLFHEQADRTPGKIALATGNPQQNQLNGPSFISYKELDEKTNLLADVLKKWGVKPNTPVGIIGNRSLQVITGILGILKSGGAFLTIDPDAPPERIRFMLNDSRLDILLIPRGAAAAPGFTGNLISLDDEKIFVEKKIAEYNNMNRPQDPVYLIYTSGTTGRPKGVIIEHRGLVNYTCWAAKIYVKNEAVDFPLYTSLCFDLTITSIFTPLITGNTVSIYEGDDKASLLGEIIDDNRVGVIKLTPSHLKLLREIPPPKNLSLKRLIVGGENLESSLAREIFDHFQGEVEIFNEYGPSETVVGCMIYRFDPDEKYGRSIPIGSAADNVKIYLLDKKQKLVPTGVVGEIYISGDGVYKGYMNGVEPTAAKLFEDAFVHAGRMYRSGDLAVQRPDGDIEFLDRSDQQVKIRGYRIEPAEIETLLKQAANIKEAVVTVREGKKSGQDRYLCAYIVSAVKEDISELQNYLAKTLPPYMTPAYFIQLDSIPLTQNGKVNKKALPAPESSLTAQFVAPRNPLENTLTAIWSQILDIDPQEISIDANFFELGGHSLKATILVARLYRVFKIKIPLAMIFNTPTVRGLAEYINNTKKIIYKTIDPVEKKEYYPVTSDQKRIYFMDIFDDKTSPFFQSFSLKLYKKLDKVRLEDITRELIKRHEVFRSTFEMCGDNLVQIVHDNFDFEVSYVDADTLELGNYMLEFNKLYDLKKTPLLRVMVVSLAEAEHLLVFNMHHILSDGVSIQILGRDFRYLEQDIRLPALRIQFKDFSEWENKSVKSKEMKNREQYWLDVFAGHIPVLNMPADFPRPPIQSFAGAQLDNVLEKKLSDELNRLSKDTETTLFMVTLAVFFILLAKYSGQEDIIIGTTVAGRNHSDLENMIGMLIKTLAIRAFPAGEKRFVDFLLEVKMNVLNALENQDYPFKELLDNIEIERDLSRNPLFDAMLLVQDIDIISTNRNPAGKNNGDSLINDVIIGLHDKKIDNLREQARHPESPVDIQLTLSEGDETVYFNLVYCTKLFKKETMERFLKFLTEIISIVSADKEIKIEDINISHDFGKAQSNMILGERTDFIF